MVVGLEISSVNFVALMLVIFTDVTVVVFVGDMAKVVCAVASVVDFSTASI